MDIIAITGVMVGVLAILGGQALEGGHVSSLVQASAAIIVLGGTLGATLVSFPGADLKRALRDLKTLIRPPVVDNEAVITDIVSMAKIARNEGLLALEKKLDEITNPFLKRYLQQIIDGLEAEIVREQMETDIGIQEEDKTAGAKVFEAAGGYSPTIGIIGAVLGLIHTMEQLNDPSKIGGGIAVAFVATVYGVGAANILFLPIANRLKRRVEEQMVSYSLIMEGLMDLQAGHNPKVIEDKLRIYLAEKKKDLGTEDAA